MYHCASLSCSLSRAGHVVSPAAGSGRCHASANLEGNKVKLRSLKPAPGAFQWYCESLSNFLSCLTNRVVGSQAVEPLSDATPDVDGAFINGRAHMWSRPSAQCDGGHLESSQVFYCVSQMLPNYNLDMMNISNVVVSQIRPKGIPGTRQ